MVSNEVGLLYVAPAIFGIIISLVEIFFVMGDEGGMHPLTHGLHAVPTCLIFTYVAMNAPVLSNYLSSTLGWDFLVGTVGNILIPVFIGLIATIKVKSAAAIISGGHNSVGEKLPHALLVGVLIGATPLAIPFIVPMLPEILRR